MSKGNLVGRIFGKQNVLSFYGRNKWGERLWKVKCECGDIRIVSGKSIFRKDRPILSCLKCRKHCPIKYPGYSGENVHYLYRLWTAIKERCYNNNNPSFKYYGGRGIIFYQEWHDFANFRDYIEEFLGERPLGYSIDRIRNNGNYEPGNVRWATKSQQRTNQRTREEIANGT